MQETCIFCQIITGKAPARILYRDEQVTAFWDTHPIAPIHILIVPNQHIPSVNEIETLPDQTLAHLFHIARRLAAEQGISQTGYRLMLNTGPDANQSVQHLHLHILGGQKLSFSKVITDLH